MKKIKKLDFFLITLLAAIFSFATVWNYQDPFVFKNFVFNFTFAFIICELLLLSVWRKILKIKQTEDIKKINRKEYFVYGGIILFILIISMIIFYPSVGNFDAECLWDNLKQKNLSNWNPIPYTLIFIGIPFLISKEIFSLTIFQVIFVFIMTLYLFIYIRKNYFNFKKTLIFLLLFVLNPIYIKYSVFVSKDTIYSWCMVFLTINLINIIKSDGKWLNTLKNKILFFISAITVLVFRHNGIIPFACTFIYLAIVMPKLRSYILSSFMTIIITFLFITGPIYRFFKVDGTLGFTETLGVIMQNLSYYNMHSENMTTKQKEFLYSNIPEEVWYDRYDSRNFNPIKNYCVETDFKMCDFTREKFEQSAEQFIKIWWKLTPRNFNLFLRSYFNIITPVFEITNRFGEIDNLYWSSPELVKPKLNQMFYDKYIAYYETVANSPLRLLFVNFGQGLFICIFALAIVIRKTKFKLKYLTPFVPVIINVLVIMLLITGEEYRFVYVQGLVFLVLAFYALYDVKLKRGQNYE